MKEIISALVKFQSEVKPISKDASNPFFKSKYATLENIWNTIRPTLTANGLAITQITQASENGDIVILKTVLMHTSGEMIESIISMKPSKQDPQGMLACLSYARRGSIAAILSLVTDDDLDGNDTIKPNMKPEVKAQPKAPTEEDIHALFGDELPEIKAEKPKPITGKVYL